MDSGDRRLFGGWLDGVDLPGATNATLAIARVTRAEAGSYTVQVRHAVASPVVSVASEPASLTVHEGGLAFGRLRHEVFLNLPGNKLVDLTNSVRFPDQPDSIGFRSQFEQPVDSTNHFGTRLSGFIVPSRTGVYRFHLASDDEGALFLSPDESPANRRLIAHEPAWNTRRTWVTRLRRPRQENISLPIHLEAGRAYFVEALIKDGDGDDNLAVTWRMADEPEPADGSPPISGQYLAVPAAWLKSGE